MSRISLTRVLSEIKTLSEHISNFPSIADVGVNKTSKVIAENCTVSQFALVSQARYDTWVAQIERLVLLKSARNQANTTVLVTVNGKQMTMDEAVSKKGMLEVQKTALNKFKSQLSSAQQVVTKADAEVQASVDKAVAAAVTSNPLTEEQVLVFKKMYEASLGKSVAVGSNIKTCLESLEKYIKEFSDEIDYVLSEANANTFVEV